MEQRSIRPAVWIGVVSGLAALALVLALMQRDRAPGDQATRAGYSSESVASVPAATPQRPGPRLSAPSSAGRSAQQQATASQDPVPYIEGWLYGDLDLREVQLVMPDNLYWQIGSPTKDPEIIEAREKEKARRNEEYGRVISGDASPEEVDAYFDYRERLSSDFLEFAEYLKRRFGDKLSDQFNGLLDLSIKLHTSKLASLPSERASSLEHSRERARIREEWQREQAEFAQD
ncbi:MAG TPA: hypothetical protein VEL28_22585 [Candidatus Binatia bacterium]|nr:hypothetical protein [Candidatus Binatia bacterium]